MDPDAKLKAHPVWNDNFVILKGTKEYKNLAISSYPHQDNMPKVSDYNTVYF